MQFPKVFFAPANGFPGASYKYLLQPLQSSYSIHFIDRVGHQPHYPVDPNWQRLVDEYLELLHQAVGKQPVLAVGHSLGGVLSYMAALRAPERFTKLVLLDPPLLTGLDSLGLKLAKRLGFIDRVTPAGVTRGRRQHWPSKEAALNYFQSKKLFARFHPACLQDYLEAGLEPDPSKGGLRLRFQPSVELAIFRNLADHLTGSHKHLKVPAHLITGQQSDLITPQRAKKLEKMGFSCHSVTGGHMFPLEHPELTRQQLARIFSLKE